MRRQNKGRVAMTINMMSTGLSKAKHFLQEYNTHLANHIIVIIAFFMPISGSVRSSGIFILLFLLFFKKDLFVTFKEVIKNRVIQAFLLYWLMNFVWVLFSIDPNLSYEYAKKLDYFYFPLLFLLYLDKAYLYRILSAFILGMLLSELLSYGLALSLIEYVPYGIRHQSALDPSPFIYHMGYGFVLTFTVALLLQRLLTTENLIQRMMYGLFFLTASANVFVNAGRTGYILYTVSILSLLLLMYRKKFFKTLPIALLFLTIVYTLAFNFSPVFQQRMGLLTTSTVNIVNEDNLNSSVGARVAMGQMAIEAIKDRPWLGHGPGTAVNATSAKAVELDSPIGWLKKIPYPNIDNQYFEILVQFGFVGFIIFLNMFYQIYRFKQPDTALKTIQSLMLILAMFYCVQVTLFQYGGSMNKIFILIITFTLVTKDEIGKLEPLTFNNFSIYSVAAITLFIISKVT